MFPYRYAEAAAAESIAKFLNLKTKDKSNELTGRGGGGGPLCEMKVVCAYQILDADSRSAGPKAEGRRDWKSVISRLPLSLERTIMVF